MPENRLVELDKLDNLPPINLPAEKPAVAIKRFDRNDNQRVHMEDFAQVLVKYPPEKYNSAGYVQIGKILYDGVAKSPPSGVMAIFQDLDILYVCLRP